VYACRSIESGRIDAPLSRRAAIASVPALSALGLVVPKEAVASKLGPVGDRVWEAMGGGPADLVFPDAFVGAWEVVSTLVKVDTPQGEAMVPDMGVVKRAIDSDLNRTARYTVAFTRNSRQQVVLDRRSNTASMLEVYMGPKADKIYDRIQWDVDDPNVLRLSVPGGLAINTRVTRRSQQQNGTNRTETSEFVEQVFDDPGSGSPTRVKASQVFTKYLWREQADVRVDEGEVPLIVATQVVSDYLTAYDGEDRMMRAGNKPVVQYTYRMAFFKPRAV